MAAAIAAQQIVVPCHEIDERVLPGRSRDLVEAVSCQPVASVEQDHEVGIGFGDRVVSGRDAGVALADSDVVAADVRVRALRRRTPRLSSAPMTAGAHFQLLLWRCRSLRVR